MIFQRPVENVAPKETANGGDEKTIGNGEPDRVDESSSTLLGRDSCQVGQRTSECLAAEKQNGCVQESQVEIARADQSRAHRTKQESVEDEREDAKRDLQEHVVRDRFQHERVELLFRLHDIFLLEASHSQILIILKF